MKFLIFTVFSVVNSVVERCESIRSENVQLTLQQFSLAGGATSSSPVSDKQTAHIQVTCPIQVTCFLCSELSCALSLFNSFLICTVLNKILRIRQ